MIANRFPSGHGKNIYGVQWTIGTSSAWTRTDKSANFPDPVPCLSGGTGSSPFDKRMPWKGMVIDTSYEPLAYYRGPMVRIPKFWYKLNIANSTYTLKIADYPADGFRVSPAHADRGDGVGERDYVLIGRYHVSYYYSGGYSGEYPDTNYDLAEFRSRFAGNKVYLMDIAMISTIRMLYLVEFADWNIQAKIGYGCDYTEKNGASDSAQYHTGTMQSSRTTYGVGVQYRYIEDLWANCPDYCDGYAISPNYARVYFCKNPTKYADINSYTSYNYMGYSLQGNIHYHEIVSDFMFPINASGTDYNTYVCDAISAASSSWMSPYNYLAIGTFPGSKSLTGGLFSHIHVSPTASSMYGARLQYLP